MNRLDRRQVGGPSAQSSWDLRAGATVLEALFLLWAAVPGSYAQSAGVETQPAATAPASIPAELSVAELVVRIAGQSDAGTRREAAVSVLRIGSDEGVKALLSIFETDNNEAAKVAVCEAIAQIKGNVQHPAFIDPLLALLQTDEPALTAAAVAALSRYSDPKVVAKLRSFNEWQEKQELVRFNKELMEQVYALTSEADRVALLQSWLKSSLAAARQTALDIIYEALKKEGAEPANGVARQIRTMLGDPDEAVRKKLVEILRDLRQGEDARRLEAMLQEGQSSEVRGAIYHALGYLRDPGSIPVCVEGLRDQHTSVAAKAASALGQLGELKPGPAPEVLASAVDALLERAADPISDPALRGNVVDAMARIADPKQPKLRDALVKHAGADERLPAIRQAAVRGLGRIGDPAQLPLLIDRLTADPDTGVREAAAEAMGKIGTHFDHLQPLRERLDPEAKETAGVQNKAWEAYRQVFSRLTPADQQRAIDSWTGTDPATAARQVELLTDRERQVATANPNPQQLARVREELGDALAMAGRPTDAVNALTRALEVAPADNPTNRPRITKKLIDAHLQTPTPEQAIGPAAQAAELDQETRDTVAARLLEYVRGTSQTDPEAALAFLVKLKQAIPGQFGPPWAEKFNGAHQALRPSSKPASAPAAG